MSADQKTEGESLLSIHAIIIMTSSGIPLFEDRFDDFSIEPTLVAGVSSALGMYMDEFSASDAEGVEILKKSGLTITSSKSRVSTIVTISQYDLIPEVITQISQAQHMIEDYYEEKFSGRDRSRELMESQIVYQIFDNSGFNVGIKKLLEIHEENILAIKEDRSIGPTQRFHLGSLIEIIDDLQIDSNGLRMTNLNNVVEHFKNRNLDDKTIGTLIILAYENKILTCSLL